MKLIIDISHPAHYHFFKNAISGFKKAGHSVMIVSRDKDFTLELLDSAGLEHVCLSKHTPGILGLAAEMWIHEKGLFREIKKFHPDALLQIGGTFIVHVGKLTGTPSIVFYDTENATLSNAITYPFADVICTPAAYKGDLGPKQVRYKGYQELAYLHPNRFTPDAHILGEAGLEKDEPFSLIRFVGWSSSHDISASGFSAKGKLRLVEELLRFGKVFISSEAPLPVELEKYSVTIRKSKIHHLMAFASLYIGESATMASESAMLGTPAIFVSPVGRGYTDEEQKKYGLVIHYADIDENQAIDKAKQLLSTEGSRKEWQTKRQKMLSEKIDVLPWIIEFVEKFVADHGKS
jgi:hypothetical protein